jgi:DNA-binding MarR family transcriptional regulator
MRRNPPTSASDAPQEALHSILRTFGLLRQVMEPYFSGFGISGPQWAVLRVLHRAESNGEGGLRLRDIGEKLLIQPPSATAVVDRLERQRLVTRRGSSTDLRVRRVSLTSEGRELVSRISVAHGDKIKTLFAGLRPAELGALLELLRKVEAHLGQLVPHATRELPAKQGEQR